VLCWGAGLLWLALSVWFYSGVVRTSPWLGLVTSPLLGLLGTVIAGLPLALLAGSVWWLVWPRHPKAEAVERYDAARAGIRPCDVCVLARGDQTPRKVAYCGKCGAFLCEPCRSRYDLRAIAALRRAAT